MRTHTIDGNGRGVGTAAKEVADHAAALARLEIELAVLELKRKAVSLELGIGFVVGAAVVAVFAVGVLLAALAAGLATFLATWLALLIVGGGLLLLAGAFAGLGIRAIKRGIPVPETAISEAKATTEALRRSHAGV